MSGRLERLEFIRDWGTRPNSFFGDSYTYIKEIQKKLPANFSNSFKDTPGPMGGIMYRNYPGKASFGRITIIQQSCYKGPMFYPHITVSFDPKKISPQEVCDEILTRLPEYSLTLPLHADKSMDLRNIGSASHPNYIKRGTRLDSEMG
jgi:hypothetical protein